MEETKTLDTILGGRIKVVQDTAGYRFSIDAIILAHHIKPKPTDTILDLGTGCGIIPLVLAYREPKTHIIGVEIQKDLAEIAEENIRLNNMTHLITIYHQDLTKLKGVLPLGGIDIVCSNPPYRKTGSGRVNPNQQRAIARHEIKASLHDILEASTLFLKKSGRIIVTYPAERLADLLCGMRTFDLEPKRLRVVHSYVDSEAKLVILEGRKGGRPGIKINPPLTIYNRDGSYTEEVQEMLA
jgi:tRNA1Val (adenine37-N6)-methyltransferase